MIKSKVFDNENQLNEFVQQNDVNIICIETMLGSLKVGFMYVRDDSTFKLWYYIYDAPTKTTRIPITNNENFS